ncbi:hypothetical protein AO398_23930 [Methylobacterium sp. GXS13]|nr:hypothetical protein AO398_23930 [Methylobacterium sp. GXS13]
MFADRSMPTVTLDAHRRRAPSAPSPHRADVVSEGEAGAPILHRDGFEGDRGPITPVLMATARQPP